MKILAIDTSCDDTCIAIIETPDEKGSPFKILSNIISSQVKIHQKWGGVYPTLAKREHQKNLPQVLKRALKKAKKPRVDESKDSSSPSSRYTRGSVVDLIAVTIGPGLEPCLWTGVNFAKELAKRENLPIVPVNHIEAHILANLLPQISEISNFQCAKKAPLSSFTSFRYRETQLLISKQLKFPAICLVVSGGHTQLILMRDFAKYRILGETRDDAAGECFDKIARILGLGYPGGPIIAAEASKQVHRGRASVKLPRPMIYQKNYDFSFSGLKTAVLYNFKKQKPKLRKSKEYIGEICLEAQQAIIDVLIKKTLRAAKDFRAKTIAFGGGVAANKELRKQLKKTIQKELADTQYLMPDIRFCTDNAAMVGVAGYFHRKETKNWKNVRANANLKV